MFLLKAGEEFYESKFSYDFWFWIQQRYNPLQSKSIFQRQDQQKQHLPIGFRGTVLVSFPGTKFIAKQMGQQTQQGQFISEFQQNTRGIATREF